MALDAAARVRDALRGATDTGSAESVVLPVAVTYVDAPADPASRVLVESCSAALQADGCALDPSAPQASRGASVAWTEGLVRAEVRVWQPGAPTAERQLVFAAADAVDERLRAVGLLVGALSREVARSAEPAPPPPPSPAPPAVAPAPPVEPTRKDRRFSLSAAVTTGPLWTHVPWGAGLRTEAQVRLSRRLALHVAGSALTAAHAAEGNVEFRSLELESGVDGQLRAGWVGLSAGPTVVGELSIASTDSRGGDAGSTLRWGAGGRLALSGVVSERLAIQAGGSVQGFSQRPALHIEQERLGGARSLTSRAWLGLELRF